MMRSDAMQQIAARGRGPLAMRPGAPVVTRPGFPANQTKPVRMKKGGMVSPRGRGCEMVKKSCKMY